MEINNPCIVSKKQPLVKEPIKIENTVNILPGIYNTSEYLPILKNKRIGMVANQGSVVNDQNSVIFLLKKNINIAKILAPEHGFYGKTKRGFNQKEKPYQGIIIEDIYGNNVTKTEKIISSLDVVVYDMPISGVRFFTYISTLKIIMEACARQNKTLLILDRPNPLGDYIDGPVRNIAHQSFVGMFPIPVVHGLTNGELALMINGEKWLSNGRQCPLKIIKAPNYSHQKIYKMEYAISPNLTNGIAMRAYPSLCFFEGTSISVGRGTNKPFEVIGYPSPSFGTTFFIPKSSPGKEARPLHENKTCYGEMINPADFAEGKLNLKYLIKFYKIAKENNIEFFTRPKWFDLLAGTSELRQQIEAGMTEDEIRATWQAELNKYKAMRQKYLLYPAY